MNAHKNARSTPFGRAVMVRRVLDDGWTVAAAASAFAVSTRTVRKWLARFRSDGLAGLQSRSSAPRLVGTSCRHPGSTESSGCAATIGWPRRRPAQMAAPLQPRATPC